MSTNKPSVPKPEFRGTDGKFLPGHKYSKGGTLGNKGGQPKKPETQLRDWEKEHPNAYAQLMDFLLECVDVGKDVESAKYLIDRLKGRPHISLDARTTLQVSITAEDLAKDDELLEAKESKLMASVSIPLLSASQSQPKAEFTPTNPLIIDIEANGTADSGDNTAVDMPDNDSVP